MFVGTVITSVCIINHRRASREHYYYSSQQQQSPPYCSCVLYQSTYICICTQRCALKYNLFQPGLELEINFSSHKNFFISIAALFWPSIFPFFYMLLFEQNQKICSIGGPLAFKIFPICGRGKNSTFLTKMPKQNGLGLFAGQAATQNWSRISPAKKARNSFPKSWFSKTS